MCCGCCCLGGCLMAIPLVCLLGAVAPWLVAVLIFLLLAGSAAARGE